MDTMVEPLNAILQEAFKGDAVAIVSKDVLAIIASGDDVRDRSRVVQSRLSSHRSQDAFGLFYLASCRPGTIGRARRTFAREMTHPTDHLIG
jgi:hypothetical protein